MFQLGLGVRARVGIELGLGDVELGLGVQTRVRDLNQV